MKTTSFMSNVLRKNLLTLLVMVVSCFAVFSSVAADSSLMTLHGHVPAVVSRLQSKGVLPAETNLNLAIGLPLRNRQALTNLLQQIYDPASPNYHHYITPEQFKAQFGPTRQDYQNVIDFAQKNGLTVVGTHPNRMLLDVRGKASDVENAFHVTLRTYRHPTQNRDFFAPDTDPSVPSTLPVQDVSGLNNYGWSHPKYTLMPVNILSKGASNVAPNVGSGIAGTYMGSDFRNAYATGTSLTGSGQTVGLYEEDGYLASDINTYETMAGLPNVPLQNVLVDGVSGLPSGNGGEIEVSLDIDMAISMAPGLSKVIVYEGPFGFQNDILNRMASDDAARQLSSSWGWLGGPSATTDQIFQQMALQGQTFFNASGDADAFTAGAGSINGVDNPNTFNAPSDSPYITQVGGTTLTMNGTGASYASETVWNWGVEYGIDGIGSSGGVSSYYSIPSWQAGINMTARGGSATMRNTPDVALTADNVLAVADGGVDYILGGTSCAAPLWAGFLALVNQQSASYGHTSIGFLNPAIYAIAGGPNYANCFHDVTTGNNTWSGSPNLFYATNNYDLCTGLGTPNGANLINALVASAGNFPLQISAPLPSYGTNLAALAGGNPNGDWELFVQGDSPDNGGIISNGWSITLTTGDPVGTAADNGLSMTASPTNLLVGGSFVYVITVTNYGPSIASNVVVSDVLPSGVQFISSSSPVNNTPSQLTWNVGSLLVNAGAQLTLTMKADSLGAIPNTAIVSSDTADPDSDDSFATATINVVSPYLQLSGGFLTAKGGFALTVSNNTPTSVIIQASTNLLSTNWVNIYTSTPPFTSPFTFTNLGSTNFPMRFYRALIGP
jgi:uncharacterized repeat protein (TIGR01451 family)